MAGSFASTARHTLVDRQLMNPSRFDPVLGDAKSFAVISAELPTQTVPSPSGPARLSPLRAEFRRRVGESARHANIACRASGKRVNTPPRVSSEFSAILRADFLAKACHDRHAVTTRSQTTGTTHDEDNSL